MSLFSPIKKLDVYRRFSHKNELLVGQIAQNKQGVYFQYNDAYLADSHNLSPYALGIR